jgi:hypothetical protein
MSRGGPYFNIKMKEQYGISVNTIIVPWVGKVSVMKKHLMTGILF